MIDLLTPELLAPRPLLDHGFLRLVDVMPRLVAPGTTCDQAIAAAARTSYGDGTKSIRDDRGLIRYLMRNWHTSPLEMVEFKFHLKLPIFVARQLVRHRHASLNETSARYSVLPEEYYVPELDRIRAQSTTNGQGSGEPLDAYVAGDVRETMKANAADAFDFYDFAIIKGVARETARTVLPVATYTELVWKIDLLNLLKFIQLRADHHAQYEIRVYADAMAAIVATLAPATWEAFCDYWRGGARLSRVEWAALQAVVTPDQWAAIRERLAGELSKGELVEWDAKILLPIA